MEHYFTDNRHLKENRKEITFRFWCFDYSFITDNGVFSKEAIDYGTQVLLKTICEREELGERILDLGCGYGPVGVVLKKIYPTKAFEMIDVNPRAVQLSKENICRNQLEADVHVSNIYEDLHQESYSDIITNPPIRAGKAVIYTMFEEAYQHLEVGGKLWVVIRKQQGAPSAVKKIKDVFGNCEIIKRDSGYYILKAIK